LLEIITDGEEADSVAEGERSRRSQARLLERQHSCAASFGAAEESAADFPVHGVLDDLLGSQQAKPDGKLPAPLRSVIIKVGFAPEFTRFRSPFLAVALEAGDASRARQDNRLPVCLHGQSFREPYLPPRTH
jgi:hypothetical protein